MKSSAKRTAFCSLVSLLVVSAVYAHPGRTDGAGGHTNHSTGEYHYHHGYDDHQHYDMNGDGVDDCPYKFDDKTSVSNYGNSSSSEIIREKKSSLSDKSYKFEETLVCILFVVYLVVVVWCQFVK